MRYGVMLAAGSLLLAGCADVARQSDMEKLSAELAALQKDFAGVNAKLDKLLKGSGGHSGIVSRRADPEKLAKIKSLSEKPTDQEIKIYVDAILAASKGQNSFSPNDPQVEMFRKIGPGHLEVLLPYLSRSTNYHLNYALPSLVQPSDKELVLRNLRSGGQVMARLAVDNGWAVEARPQIIALFRNGHGNYFWGGMMDELIGKIARTPEEREEILDIFITYPNTSEMFRAICRFPGVDVAAIAKQGWESHQYDQPYSMARYASYAAQYGDLKALEALLVHMADERGRRSHVNSETVSVLVGLLKRPFNPSAMLKYVQENQGKLVFDSEKRQYVLKDGK